MNLASKLPMSFLFADFSLAERIYWAVATSMALAFLITLLMPLIDVRTIDGHVSVWAKPLKFEFSLAVHAATLALVMGRLSDAPRFGASLCIVAFAFLAASTIEMGWIILQGARGQQSHFNMATPFTRAMYSVMALMAVVIIGAAGAIGLAVMADRGFSGSSALRLAVMLGLFGGTALTLVTAFTIGGRLTPYVSVVPGSDARMVLTGWSLTGGDLRASHFLSTHMIQAIPLAALLVDRLVTGRMAIALVTVSAALWTLATLVEYRTALSGAPAYLTRIMP
jgi:hypothetical protein